MSNLLVPFIVLWAAVLVRSNHPTVHILRNSTKVDIEQEESHPTVATTTQVPAEWTTETSTEMTTDNWNETFYWNETFVSNYTEDNCIRKDYEEDVFSMTRLDDTSDVTYYNATLWAESQSISRIYDIIDDKNLTLISQNITECIDDEIVGAGLGPGALASLAG